MTACTERSFLRSWAGRSQGKTVCASSVASTSSDAALGVALVEAEEEAQHLVGRVDAQPDQGHQEPGAPVVGELGAAARRALAGLPRCG